MPPFRERERERDGTIKIVKGEQVVAWWWGLTVVFHPHSNPTVTAVVEWGGEGGWGGTGRGNGFYLYSCASK